MSENIKILFLVTEDWYFWSHRLPLARAMKKEGFEVIVAVRVNDHGDRIIAEGFRLIPLKLNRSGKNPLREIAAIVEIVRIYRREKPDIVHHVALKPVLYGYFATLFSKVPNVVNALAGLGHIFVAKGGRASFTRLLVGRLFKLALGRKNSRTIFQNPDDRDLFVKLGLLENERAVLIKGSGVDTEMFKPPANEPDGKPAALFASRMLWTKGVGEFVQMARELKKKNVDARFLLAGAPDFHNPAAVPDDVLKKWEREGVVEYLGNREDMPDLIKNVSVVVLPSHYGEGVPKILIEGAASSRPLVSYDVSGCKEIVRDNENGFLVPPGDVDALADAVEKLLLDSSLRKRMGAAGRKIVEEEFSESRVVQDTLNLYKTMLAGSMKKGF